jgi:hypothetical protein
VQDAQVPEISLSLIANVYRVVLDYQTFSIENVDEWHRAFTEHYALGRQSCLRERVALYERELYNRPVEQRLQLLMFLEKRQQHVMQNFIVMTSALLGGIVGSLVMLALAK